MKIIHIDLTEDGTSEPDLRKTLVSRIDPTKPHTVAIWNRLIDLAEILYNSDPESTVVTHLMPGELWWQGPRILITVEIDSFDHAPLVNGLPVYHYRLKVRNHDGRIRQEVRLATATESASAILSELAKQS